jgi:diaminopimelate epimerase
MKLYKYQGAGNDFVIVDNRNDSIKLSDSQIRLLCDRRYGIGADGLMLLCKSENDNYDFRMLFFNSDGFEGSMCGNGARCLVAFAARMGFKQFNFIALDGAHSASVLKYSDTQCTIKLKIKDVTNIYQYSPDSYFLDTGVSHLVIFKKDLNQLDIDSEGKYWRHHQDFNGGTNVNFISEEGDHLAIRTYEKGVEAETYACGTGATASAIGAYISGKKCYTSENGTIHFNVKTIKDMLEVEFKPSIIDNKNQKYLIENVYLIGPATYVFETEISL